MCRFRILLMFREIGFFRVFFLFLFFIVVVLQGRFGLGLGASLCLVNWMGSEGAVFEEASLVCAWLGCVFF